MKYVFLLHEYARPHTSLPTREAIARMGWALVPYRTHTPELAPFDYHVCGPVKGVLCGRHSADDNKNFCDIFRSSGSKFYNTGIQRLNHGRQKCFGSNEGFVQKTTS
jgi:hypothetical protein